MDIQRVDEYFRQFVVDPEAFRVRHYFKNPPSADGVFTEHRIAEWRLTDCADIREILAWSSARAKESNPDVEAVFLESTDERDQTILTLLFGCDPTVALVATISSRRPDTQ